MEISSEVKALSAEMTSLRRDLHAHPELGFQEVRTGLGKTGVTGLLGGGKPGKTVLLRADIDALPIREETNVPWRSETAGVMHACGHDAHTAMGLAAAAILAKEAPSLAGDLFFVFQPAEELLIGAEAMLKDGALEGVRADAAFAIHLMNRWPVGTVAICDGSAMTSADKLTLTITGQGGHGASPHLAIDPIVASAQIITALQTLVSRETPPLSVAVLSLTTLKAGTAFNIIPDAVEMTGTLRCFDAALREKLLAGLHRTAEGLAASLRCTARVESQFLTPALRNDPAATALAREVAATIVGESRIVAAEPLTGSDDVAYFWERVPGCYAFVGSAKPEWSPAPAAHNAKFDIDESAMEIGTEFLVRAARAALQPR